MAYHTITLYLKKRLLPDLDNIPSRVADSAKVIWINYPNNPTAATAGTEFYISLANWALEHDVVVISDNPYADVFLDNIKPSSFLNADRAKEVGVELNSLSKSFNCCGMRIGMLVGNSQVIDAMRKVKSQSDRGPYYPLQEAAISALTGPVD